ncbi:hypothetical protein [Amycolatopsis sp. RTGN1]|uniref:hypothetical protein n=1 Tax=Amycolatopsis ponsaeliensis TaxID=2992142 RepID=UPI00254D8405|nr:hypothetical protein [Amycolatopsis sp. RTGN1]
MSGESAATAESGPGRPGDQAKGDEWIDPKAPPEPGEAQWEDLEHPSPGETEPTHRRPGQAPLLLERPTFREVQEAADRQHRAEMQSSQAEHAAQLQLQQTRHAAGMQQKVLLGVGFILLAVFGTIFAAVWNHAVAPDFALEMSRMIIPALLGSASTIVGALFIVGGRRRR